MRTFPLLGCALFAGALVIGCGGDGGAGGGGSSANGGSSGGTSAGGGTTSTGAAGTATTGTNTSSGASCTDAPRDGKVTYYDFADGSGACSFDPTPNDLMVGAMNAPDYLASAACGACAQITGGDGKQIVVRIVDLCPECQTGHIDLSPEAFGKLGDLSLGVMPVTWEYVSCDYQGPIQYKFKEGSNQWWTAVQIRHHQNRIAKFEYEKDGAWVEVARTDYNYFVEAAGMGPGPYHFRVTDIAGQVLEDSGIPFQEGGVIDGTGQFASCSN
ncbi:MAG: expansin EXLX1 family cellulose-binding protein [Polyangiaceae bacterium]